eukprot:m.44072 g.44072  ORF g.44072 m.44072 type:complete len:354 (-) comp10044_c0_seq2:83-1144(-)
MATKLADYMEQLGATVYWDEVVKGRPNVYGIFKGRDTQAEQIMRGVDVHLDTVGVDLNLNPFSGCIDKDKKLHGRGSCDTKATLAATLAALSSRDTHTTPLTERLNCSFIIAGTADEEKGPLGARQFEQWLQQKNIFIDELIVAEPTECTVVRGHKGVVRLDFEITGISAHSSTPDQGKNALVAASAVVQALQSQHSEWKSEEGELGFPTIVPTMATSGSGVNVVPGSATISCDIRITETQSVSDVARRMALIAEAAAKETGQCASFNWHTTCAVNPFLQQTNSFVKQMSDLTGNVPTFVQFGTNASQYMNTTNVKNTIVLGPGSINQAHQDDEWITLAQLNTMQSILTQWLA